MATTEYKKRDKRCGVCVSNVATKRTTLYGNTLLVYHCALCDPTLSDTSRQKKKRECLSCEKMFNSKSKENRRCQECRRNSEYNSETEYRTLF